MTSELQHRALALACEHLVRLDHQILAQTTPGPSAGPVVICRGGDEIVFVAITASIAGTAGTAVAGFPRCWSAAHRRRHRSLSARFDTIHVVVDARLALVSLTHRQRVAQSSARARA